MEGKQRGAGEYMNTRDIGIEKDGGGRERGAGEDINTERKEGKNEMCLLEACYSYV